MQPGSLLGWSGQKMLTGGSGVHPLSRLGAEPRLKPIINEAQTWEEVPAPTMHHAYLAVPTPATGLGGSASMPQLTRFAPPRGMNQPPSFGRLLPSTRAQPPSLGCLKMQQNSLPYLKLASKVAPPRATTQSRPLQIDEATSGVHGARPKAGIIPQNGTLPDTLTKASDEPGADGQPMMGKVTGRWSMSALQCAMNPADPSFCMPQESIPGSAPTESGSSAPAGSGEGITEPPPPPLVRKMDSILSQAAKIVSRHSSTELAGYERGPPVTKRSQGSSAEALTLDQKVGILEEETNERSAGSRFQSLKLKVANSKSSTHDAALSKQHAECVRMQQTANSTQHASVCSKQHAARSKS